MNALIEPFYLCLIASMIWAPLVFLAAGRYCGEERSAIADKIWPIALFIAALPALLAPAAAALGISLRTEQPLPPMAAPSTTVDVAAILDAAPAATLQPAFDAAALLQAGAALYFYGFFLILALGVARLIGFSYRVRYAFEIDEPLLEAALDNWRRRMGVKQDVRYAFTDAVSSVCVHGFFRPVILMPMNLLDRISVDDAALMGAHEMAHIRRGDTWLFAYTKFVKAVFWFNPFIHRICARAQLAAEQAADALVIARGVDRREYARCFVQGLRAAAGLRANEHALVPSFTPFDKRSRRERLDAILSSRSAGLFLTWRNKIGLILSVIAAGGLAFAQAALAVAPKPPAEALPETPLEGKVSLGFGDTSVPLGEDRKSHEGVDIKAPRGAAVRAAGDGKVIAATPRYKGSRAWGNVVVIDHGHGLVTRYAHLDSYNVRKGDWVRAGDEIGAVGATGKATGPHLHFEVIRDGIHIDPTPVIAAKPMPAPKPLPVMKPSRSVAISPAPEIAAMPTPDVAPEPTVEPVAPAHDASLNFRLAERFEELEGRVEEAMEGFENMRFEVGEFDVDFDAIADAQRVALASLEIDGDFGYLSEDDREEIRAAQRAAMEEAREAMRRVERDRERVERERDRAERARERERERAERERERAEQERERQRERAAARAEKAALEAERARERAERDFERSMERAEQRAEHARESAEREWSHAMHNSDGVIDEQEVLKIREKALREAKADLERELAEIKRQRAALKRRSKSKQNDG